MGGGGSKSEAKEIDATASSIANQINVYTVDQNVETFANNYNVFYLHMTIGIAFLLLALFIHSKSKQKNDR